MPALVMEKPVQALRRSRPSLSTRNTSRQNTVDGQDEADEQDSLPEPLVRDTAHILRKFRGSKPSLIVHLHPTNFRFDQQEGSFSYDSPMKVFIQHLQKQTVPHDLIDLLHSQGVTFYDGCLIVEVHNHITSSTKSSSRARSVSVNGTVPFSMHNYNEHITPSPFVPYPKKPEHGSPKAKFSPQAEQKELEKESMAAPPSVSKPTKQGPTITTMVLHATPLSRHNDVLLLANTPAVDIRGKKSNGTPATATAPPATPVSAAPPSTPRDGSTRPVKMMLDEKDLYAFEAQMLLATEAPLLLEPAKNPEEAQQALDLLKHPLHSEPPPSSQSRKRTYAEIAADDAQAAELERRMLIMDERVKPSLRAGTNAGDGQSGTAALGFSRFKTLETIRQRHEERERQRKEEEARAATEKRQHDMQMAAQRKKLVDEQNRQRQEAQAKHMMRQQAMQQQQAQAQAHAQAQAQAQQQQHAHAHAHPPNMSQQQFAQQVMAQQRNSPVAGQPTPMAASSPMMNNVAAMSGGFPMASTVSNQGAGSPARPQSAMQHPQVAMARQMSQQQSQSRHNTPPMAGATPHMAGAGAIPISRQMSSTPQIAHVSPVQGMQGTPNSGMMSTPHLNQQHLNPQLQQQQMAMLRQRQLAAQAQAQAQVQAQGMQHLPAAQQELLRQQMTQQQQTNPQAYQQQMQRMQQLQQQQQNQNVQMNQAAAGQQNNTPIDPQMMQQRQLQLRQQQQMRIQQIAAQNGGVIPPQVRQQLLNQQEQQQQQLQQQMQAQQLQQQQRRAAQAAQAAGQGQGQGQSTPGMRGVQERLGLQERLGNMNDQEQYMHNLRNQQAILAKLGARGGQNLNAGGQGMNQGQQQQQQQMMGNQQMNMAMQRQMSQQPQSQQQQQQQQMMMMNGQGMNGQGVNGQGGLDLSREFQQMQNALNQQPPRPGTGMS